MQISLGPTNKTPLDPQDSFHALGRELSGLSWIQQKGSPPPKLPG